MEDTRLAILIAEDDPTLGEALAGYLRDKGHEVALARDGGEALNYLSRQPFSLVITDLIMPVADGLAVLKACQALMPPPLVVVMTGYASIDSALQATREGAYDYLRKPFKLQEIELAVTRAFHLLTLYRQNQALLHKLEQLTARLASLTPEGDEPPGLPRNPSVSRVSSPAAEGAGSVQIQMDLQRLRQLYEEHMLTDQEYHALKQRLLV